MKYHAINPYYVTLIPLLLFLITFFYPSNSWYTIFEEANVTYLSFGTLAFILVCLLFLVFGIILGSTIKITRAQNKIHSKLYFNLLLAPVLTVTAIVFVFYIIYLATNFPGYLLLTISGEGDLVKSMVAGGQMNYSTLPNFAIPIVWWGWYRYYSFSDKLNTILYLLRFTTLLLLIILVVNAARFALMPFIIGWFVIYTKLIVFDKTSRKNHKSRSIKFVLILSLVILVLFSLFAIARGIDNLEDLFSMILGYGPVSFNRLGAIFHSNLTFTYSNTFVYVIPEPFFTAFRYIFSMQTISGHEVWLSEFDGIQNANLNHKYIWLTIFGYVYDSIGLFSFFYFFIYGIITGLFWIAFLKGRLIGIVMYPLTYFSIFFFFGSNYLITFFAYYLLIYALLYCWELFIIMLIYLSKPSRHKEIIMPLKYKTAIK